MIKSICSLSPQGQGIPPVPPSPVHAITRRALTSLLALTIGISSGTAICMQKAYADVIYELQSQYGFIDSAFTIEERRSSQPELESLSGGWSWKSSYNGVNRPYLVYNSGYFTGSNPLDATVRYRNIGKVDGRSIDARIRYKSVGAWSDQYWTYTSSCIELKDFWGGCTYFCCGSLGLVYSLYYADTGEQLDMTGAWMTLGSLNTGEGVRYNTSGTIKSTVLKNNNLQQLGNGYWKGISNNFQDGVGTSTFTRNAVSFSIKDPTMDLTMISDSGAMWMFPLFTPLETIRPTDPIKTATVID